MDKAKSGGESDLRKLLGGMQPSLNGPPFVFASVPPEVLPRLPFVPLGQFREGEGVTVIVPQSEAGREGWKADDAWACITLSVRSSLHAVGFLAAVAAALARQGISVNAVSAFYHDHLFVPWEERGRAMDVLLALARPG
jgi:hypothetical protein